MNKEKLIKMLSSNSQEDFMIACEILYKLVKEEEFVKILTTTKHQGLYNPVVFTRNYDIYSIEKGTLTYSHTRYDFNAWSGFPRLNFRDEERNNI